MGRAAVRAGYVYVAAFFPTTLGLDENWPPFGRLWDPLVSWTARVVFHDTRTLGVYADEGGWSGLYEHYHAGIALFLAVVLGVIWAAVAARRRVDADREAKLRAWLATTARVILAVNMFDYGLSKVFAQQFGRAPIMPPYEILALPYGSNQPSGIVWWFMAHSRLYQVWAGLLEVGGGALLLSRKTADGGALILVGVIGNVVFLDYGFDVSPRFWALQLWMLALILSIPAARRAIDVFVRNVRTEPAKFTPLFDRPRTRSVVVPLVALFVTARFVLDVRGCLQSEAAHARLIDSSVGRKLAGIYDVTAFVRGTDSVPALATNATRWRRVTIEPNGTTALISMDDRLQRYWAQLDTVTQLLTLRVSPTKGPYPLEKLPAPLSDSGALRFHIDWPSALRVTLRGQVGADSVAVVLQRWDDERLPLRRPRSMFIDFDEDAPPDSSR